MARAPTPRLADARLLDAAERVLLADGWDGLSIERVAAEAGLSRVTAWRQGATKETIIDALITRLGTDYRAAMWPVLTASGTGAERLQQALTVLCQVAERHLPLLIASDTVFHQDSSRPVDFTEPLVRLVSDGRADGSLQVEGTDRDIATTLFNTVCWPYVHLRGHHHWSPAKTRTQLLRLVVSGVGPSAARGGKARAR
jgi:AcrR family transcriptional regulator